MPLLAKLPRRFRRRQTKRPEYPPNSQHTTRSELDKLVQTVADPRRKKLLNAEMESFYALFSRYQREKDSGAQIQWENIKPLQPSHAISYQDLPPSKRSQFLLNKLAIIKVNGGLGSSMGLSGAKSSLQVQEGLSFLDLTIHQVQHMNKTFEVDIPLLFMTSFSTHEDTARDITKYADQGVRVDTFSQSRFPRISPETHLPLADRFDSPKSAWYPPGHGNLYESLVQSGFLEKLIAEGKEYLFISNSDNLGATADERILQYMVDSELDFIMEVTDKTKADIKGGTLVPYGNTMRLLEISQVPPEHEEEFTSVRKFKVLNTNNLWINIQALKRVMQAGMQLEILTKVKRTADGRDSLQLETAAGAAIKYFPASRGLNVPRSRFLPVKNCSDLLLVRSKLYSIKNGSLNLNESRMFASIPSIKLGSCFQDIQDFQRRFKRIPEISELDHLTVTGNVWFGEGVILRGTVIVIAKEGEKIDVPSGSVLENRLLSGDFRLIDL